jgi:glutathionylspermidine synthase
LDIEKCGGEIKILIAKKGTIFKTVAKLRENKMIYQQHFSWVDVDGGMPVGGNA